MPRRLPKLCRHKPSNRAYATDPDTGREVYFGAWGSASAEQAYGRWIQALLARRPAAPIGLPAGSTPTVAELVSAYLTHVRGYYIKHGRPTSEPATIEQAARVLLDLYPQLPAAQFGPTALKAVRQAMIAKDWARGHVNSQVQRIRRMWRWGVEHELVPADAWHGLRAVQALAAGRTSARESEPIEPADPAAVAAALPYLTPTLAAMVQVQLFSGCRPQDVCILRKRDVDFTALPWIYTPASHKTEHRGHERKIWLGPQARAVLAPLLDGADPDAWLFRVPRGNGKRIGRYSSATYRQAISITLKTHGLPHWTPGQLRHTQATAVRARYGLEAAQVYLGHSGADVTQIYAERNESLARKVAEEMG